MISRPIGCDDKATCRTFLENPISISGKNLSANQGVSVGRLDERSTESEANVVGMGDGRRWLKLVFPEAGPDDAFARDGVGRRVEGDVAQLVRPGKLVGLFRCQFKPGRVVLGVGDEPAVLGGFDLHWILAADHEVERRFGDAVVGGDVMDGEEEDALATVIVEADKHALSDAAVDREGRVRNFSEGGRWNLGRFLGATAGEKGGGAKDTEKAGEDGGCVYGHIISPG